MEFIMTKDKVTPGTIRFAGPKTEGDLHSKNIYLTKAEVKALGDPEKIKVTIEAA